MLEATLDSEINVWVRLLFLKFFEEKIKSKMTAMPRLILKSIKIVMRKILRGWGLRLFLGLCLFQSLE